MRPELITEEEAGRLWCPRAVAPHYNSQTSCNRDPDGCIADGCHCLARGCAAWVYGKNIRGRIVGYCGLLGANLPDNTDLKDAHL
jgi:hypothetical protein